MTNGEVLDLIFPDSIFWFTDGDISGVDDMTILEWKDKEYAMTREKLMQAFEEKRDAANDLIEEMHIITDMLDDMGDDDNEDITAGNIAEFLYEQYEAFIEVGFTQKQAFTLVNTIAGMTE